METFPEELPFFALLSDFGKHNSVPLKFMQTTTQPINQGIFRVLFHGVHTIYNAVLEKTDYPLDSPDTGEPHAHELVLKRLLQVC